MPADRTIWPPLPGMSSMLWIVVPSGMFAIGSALPTRASASGPGHDDVTDLQAVRQEHVALLAVAVEEQPDPGRAVRVVLDRREPGRHAELVALEVDPAVVLLLAAAAVADGEPAGVVPAGAARLRLEQRLVRLVGRDLLERRAGHLPEARRGRPCRNEAASSDPLEELDLLAGGQGHDRLAPRRRPAGDPAAPRAAALLLGLRREDVDADDGDLLLGVELLDRRLDLDLVGVVVDGERVLLPRLAIRGSRRRSTSR